MIFLFKPEEH